MPAKRIRKPAKKVAVVPVVAYQPSDLIIKDTPDKGKGVFSSTAIPQGTLIIAEEPIVTFPAIHSPNQIVKAAEACSQEARDKLLTFSYSPAYASLHPFHRIAKTNCVPMPERGQAGLFETICRVNHDCRSNAQYFWNEALGKEVLHALVDIPTGEEITVCYSTVLDRRERRETLQSSWAFSCQCPSCLLPPDDLAKSDQRMSQLSDIIDAVPMLLHTSPISALAKIRQAVGIIEEEKYYSLLPAQYYDAFQTCVAWGDLSNSKVWAGRAADAYSRSRGAGGPDVVRMRAFEENPKSHPSWGKLGTRRLNS
ncbi:hypothetical protein FRB95_014437 [Tulasnella sp. JGI-2019a]|nr:hypothetical protein FRB95_014437 [Tulasnella sp. JGI-2019a]